MGFSIVHLTDVHFSENVNLILERTDKMVRAINSVLVPNEPIIMIINGDIAFSGKEAEYHVAQKFFDHIRDAINAENASSCEIMLVPGNHDCEFSGSQIVREKLLSSLDVTSSNVDKEIYEAIVDVQKNFFNFSQRYNCPIDKSQFCTLHEVECDGKKILFLLLNSAWMSQINEQPGKLFAPCNLLPYVSSEEFDCVFAVMHHPYGWFHPDNAIDFLNYIRRTVDVLMLGHEHRKDYFQTTNGKWSIVECRGKELQSDDAANSSFSVYRFEQSLQEITCYTFSWNTNVGQYERIEETPIPFMRNSLIESASISPNRNYLQHIADPGMIINHFDADEVKLSDLFCWPFLERLSFEEKASITNENLIKHNIPDILLQSHISVVIGDSLSGRTSLAKMLFKSFLQHSECCLLCEGKQLTTYKIVNIRKILEEVFQNEYDESSLETYRQLSANQRILIIDNFQDIPYHDERRSKILSALLNDFQHIIVFSDSSLEMQIVCSKIEHFNDLRIEMYGILNFGNQKRRELVKKWYSLGNEYAEGDRSIEELIDQACGKIDILLGSSGGIVPALPIYLINILQNIDSMEPYSGSQYGFLYESLINKSLSKIGNRYRNSGSVNIDINVLSKLAFEILREGKRTFSRIDLHEVVSSFEKQMKVSVDGAEILSKMHEAKIIREVDNNVYRFRYPYIFYFFAGRYIAYHLKDSEVKEQLEYMSDRLYNETYGNIIIFVCHFANNVTVIEDILLHAYETLNEYDIFDFEKHTDFFSRARIMIEKTIVKPEVGTDAEVENNKSEELARLDDAGIHDGSIVERPDMTDEIADKEKSLAAMSAAFRIMDVLGQILCNYPGDIDGVLKIQIIDEIHKLGMRSTEVLFSAVGILEQDLILFISEKAKGKVNPEVQTEVVEKTREMLSCLMAGTAKAMINKIAACYNNDALLPAIKETFSTTDLLSQELVLQELKFNMLRKPDVEGVITLNNSLERRKAQFGQTILRSIVAHYLRYNHCSHDTRQKLCSNFELQDNFYFIERKKLESTL